MLALIEKGMSRDDAYKLVQSHTSKAWDEGHDFRDLILQDATVLEQLTAERLNSIFDYSYYTKHVDSLFARVGLNAVAQSATEASHAPA
jgi:adenylosuccinate lyase